MPVYLSGMARGLLGKHNSLQKIHNRKQALKNADLIILAGVPCDFRLDYGRHLSKKATFISINGNKIDLFKNKSPDIAVHTNSALFLKEVAEKTDTKNKWKEWMDSLDKSDDEKEINIAQQATEKNGLNKSDRTFQNAG